MIADAWPEAVGIHFAAKTKPLSFTGGILFVWVKDSVWAQHLSLQKPKIIARLNRLARTRILKDIRFQVGGTPPVTEESPVEEGIAGKDWRQIPLPPEQINKIEKLFRETELAPDIEEKIREFLISQKQRLSWLFGQGHPPCKKCGMPADTRGDYCTCCLVER